MHTLDVECVIVATAQLRGGTGIVDADAQRPLLASALRVLEIWLMCAVVLSLVLWTIVLWCGRRHICIRCETPAISLAGHSRAGPPVPIIE